MNKKVLIISDSPQFTEYTKQLLSNSRFNVPIMSVAKRLIDSERYFKEYLHNVVIIDVDTQNGLLGKTVSKIKGYASSAYILCIENEISIEMMRSMFKTGVDDYISIQEMNSTALDKVFSNLSLENKIEFEKEDDFELEHQLGLIRDGQIYQKKVIHKCMQSFYENAHESSHMVFFRIDNIGWIYHHTIFDRQSFKIAIEAIIRKHIKKDDVVFFTKKHSGFMIVNKENESLFKDIQASVKNELDMSISFIVTNEPLAEETFIGVYKRVLEVLDSTFYLEDGIIINAESADTEHGSLRELPNNFSVDIQYRFRKKDYLNSDYFINKSLEFIEVNKIIKTEALEFYSHMYQRVVQEQFRKKHETILELKEQIRQIYMVNKFEDLKLRVLIINELIKSRLVVSEQEKTNPYITNIYEYVDKHIDERITLRQLSDHLGITEIYISRLFKEEIGTNLFTQINSIKMKKAATLLQEDGISISEAAQKVGFSDPLYFSRVFKTHYGVSPSKFRQVRRKS